jgi:16S rRNA G966 N2-methylase RsmD
LKTDEEELNKLNLHEPTFSTLSNGIKIDHPWWLKGGGNFHYPYFLEAIKQHGKPHYKRAFEWCAGHGFIGWELLTNNYCDELTFSDIYPPAIETCRKNAEQLGYASQVTSYITGTISTISEEEKWDLVVGNPPNSGDVGGYMEQYLGGKNHPPEMIRLAIRTTVDQDWEAHRDFFKHIKKHLNTDADIFLSMHDTVFNLMKSFYEPENFKMISITDMIPWDPNLKVAHFKYIE